MSETWWGAKHEMGSWGQLRCNKADIGESWLWQYLAYKREPEGKGALTVVLQGMRKSERGAKRNALIETQRYLGAKMKLLGKVEP